MYDHIPFFLQITRADIMPQVKWVANLVTTNDHCDLPQEFVCAHMGYHAYFMYLEGLTSYEGFAIVLLHGYRTAYGIILKDVNDRSLSRWLSD